VRNANIGILLATRHGVVGVAASCPPETWDQNKGLMDKIVQTLKVK